MEEDSSTEEKTGGDDEDVEVLFGINEDGEDQEGVHHSDRT